MADGEQLIPVVIEPDACPECGNPSTPTDPVRRVSDDDRRFMCSSCYVRIIGESSVHKLHRFIEEARDRPPASEDEAQRRAFLQMAVPFMGSLIPDDPDELDTLLENLARWAIAMRSDDAAEVELLANEPAEPPADEGNNDDAANPPPDDSPAPPETPEAEVHSSPAAD